MISGEGCDPVDENPFLKLVLPPKGKDSQTSSESDPLRRLKGVVLNLTESALDCLNRISRKEMQKESPSPKLMEEYFLLHHYLDFIKRFCQDQ
jgi:hypothetical protein